jgi:Bax protein
MNRSAEVAVQASRPFHLAVGGVIFVSIFALAMAVGRPRPQFPSLPDFTSYARIEDMKAAFFDYLTPIVNFHNGRILQDRKHLKRISAAVGDGGRLSWVDSMWLRKLAKQYAVAWHADKPGEVVRKLLLRVDIIPVPLVLVQAAKESSWGQSRFAVQAHNLFGQWCFHQGCGVEPDHRPPGTIHEVRTFKTASESVQSYLHNLNTHTGYADLRRIRHRLRVHGQPVTARALAEGLSFYSQRRKAYVEEVKSMIAQYQRFQDARAD